MCNYQFSMPLAIGGLCIYIIKVGIIEVPDAKVDIILLLLGAFWRKVIGFNVF